MSDYVKESAYKKRLLIGFLVSLLCTLLVYLGVVANWFSGQVAVVFFILSMAFIQAVVQARFFLHLDEESKPRWQLHSFWFSVLMMLVIVVGSLWIMINLNYNMGMSPQQMDEYMMKQNKKGF
jgi:cytochrome o ubiquinol oxidase operon protein cyoD